MHKYYNNTMFKTNVKLVHAISFIYNMWPSYPQICSSNYMVMHIITHPTIINHVIHNYNVSSPLFDIFLKNNVPIRWMVGSPQV